MNSYHRTLFTQLQLRLLACFLFLVGTQAAYAQVNTPDKAVAKMTIAGLAGDNADGTIEVVGIDQQLINAPSSGGTDPRPIMAFLITKKIDRATPSLFLASMRADALSLVKITWTKLNPVTNQEEFSYSITLRRAFITLVHQRPADRHSPESRQSDQYEDIRLIAGIVEWDYVLPGGHTLAHAGWDFSTGIAR